MDAPSLDRLTTALADRYRILREVGAGGMATVYLADDLRHHRQVALKVLRPELAATMGPERFFREIRVAARLQHPHILPLYDSGEAEGFLWFVMPYVSGESLRGRLEREGELPIGDAVRILVEVADALSHAHAQGVVHRDIKPDNVLLTGRHALVTDFGVAKAVSEAAGTSTLTTAGVALGTPAYMAPEQAAADPQLDHRVDVYAVGILGYELLTGRTPFGGLPPAQTLAAHVSEPPAPIRRHREACPPGLEAVIMRCLAKRPSDRWQSTDELVHALEPFAVSSGGTTPAQTRPTTTEATAAAPRVRSRAPLLVGIGAALALALALAAVAGWATLGGRRSASVPSADAVERVQLTSTGSARSPALSPDGTRLAYAERSCDAAGRCGVDIRVQDVAGAGAATVARGLQGVGGVAWSPDGRWLLVHGSMSQRWGVFAVPSLGGDPRFLGCCYGTLHTQGDTVLVMGPPPDAADTSQVLRRITIGDGVVHDSVVLSRPAGVALMAAWDVPGSERRLVALNRGARLSLLLMDRAGRQLDSLDAQLEWRGSTDVRFDGDGFTIPVRDEARQDRFDFVHYAFDGRDRIARTPTLLAKGVSAPAGFGVAGSGAIVIAAGSQESAVWALERRTTADSTFSERLVARSTSELMGTVTADGDRVVLLRSRPSDPTVRDISIVPFAGGAEVPLGPHAGVIDWDLHQDGRGLVLGASAASDSVELREITIPGAQARALGKLPPGSRSIETVDGGGLVYAFQRSIGVRGVRARRDTLFSLPAEASGVEYLEPLPGGESLLAVSWDPPGDSILVHRVALRDGRSERLVWRYSEGAGAPAAFADGSVLFEFFDSQYNSTWYRLAPGATTLTRLGVPPRPDASYRFARSGLRGVARERVLRSDIYLLKGLLPPVTGR